MLLATKSRAFWWRVRTRRSVGLLKAPQRFQPNEEGDIDT
jgi:hypothetical protein